MRLLTLDGDGGLAWVEFSQDKIPPYAILSHTWGTEEVSFLDLLNGNGKTKAGYRKILFCGEQAARDNLHYFWVDTCCIDKRDNTELTKAINSMFRWYRNATKCYVYLSDVSTSAAGLNAERCRSTWEADFRQSRWFTRGWTLQELLAPAFVEFYSSQHQRLGDKGSLCPLIHDITSIPIPALRGHPLDTFSVSERMTWAAKRQTTEDEDGAYCLLGIFNIFMPLIYGEGRDSALKRLQREVDGLPATGMASVIERVYLRSALTFYI
jgi:Heterokaryon incompatibility protein (HET)